MKPSTWKKMSKDERKSIATGLLQSTRGTYILSQALHYAIQELKKVPKPFREESNIQDMEMLQEEIFVMFFPYSEEQLALRKAMIEKMEEQKKENKE